MAGWLVKNTGMVFVVVTDVMAWEIFACMYDLSVISSVMTYVSLFTLHV